MRFTHWLCGVAGAAAFVQQATIADAAPQPVAAAQPQWILDQSGYYCALAAKLNGNVQATMVLRTLPGSWIYDLSLVGAGWPSRVLMARDKAGIVLTPSGTSEAGSPNDTIIDRGRMLYLEGISSAFLDAFGKSAQLSVAVDGKRVLDYALPPSANAAMDALNQCVVGKLTEAGADPAGFEPGGRQPEDIGDRSKWVELPPLLSMGNAAIHAAVRLDIGLDGKPSGCGVLELIGRLDRQSLCRDLMQHARYRPALNPHGTPVKAVVVFVLNEQYRAWMTFEK